MSAVKNVIFDLGAVLLNIDPERSIHAFKGLTKEGTDWNKVWHSSIEYIRALEAGQIKEADFLDALRTTINPALSDEEIIYAWNKILLDFPPARIDMLRKIRKHYKTYLLSNSNNIHFRKYSSDLKKLEKGGFEALFDGIVFSYLAGASKPDPAIYQHLLQKHDLQPATCLFIDDREDNIIAAKEFGIQTIWLKEGMEVTSLFTVDGLLRK